MKSHTRSTVVATLVLIFSLAGSVIVLRSLDKVRGMSGMEDVLYIPSAKFLKRASFGYDGLMADIYWTRVVQYYGNLHHQELGTKRYDLLYPLLDITTTLDPHLLPAYQFGSIFLSQKPPEGAGEPEKAIEIVSRGIAANPSDWHLFYNLGFIYYEMKDYAGAARTFGEGATVPGANPHLKVLQAAMTEKAGSPETSRLLWREIYETSEDKNIRAGALRHLIALQIDQDVVTLAKLVADYRQHTGQLPTNFQEMVAAGWLKRAPVDPTGDSYKLLPDGRVEVKASKNKPFVQYGLPGGPQGPEETIATSTP